MKRKKLLFLQPSQKPVHKIAGKNMFYHMSQVFEGDAVSFLVNNTITINSQDLKEVNALLPTFTYHARNRSRLPRLFGLLVENFYLLKKGVQLCRKNKYDAIVAHSTSLSGIVALILRRIFGGKVIVNIPTHPVRFYTRANKKLSLFDNFKLKSVNILGSYITNQADMVKLVYSGQIDDVPTFIPKKQAAFVNFVPVSHISQFRANTCDKTILLVGSPWYIKGYDVLIKAFDLISDQHPEYTLHIIGNCPNERKKKLKESSKHTGRIFIHDYMHNDAVINMMARCSIYVNASRTEGVARVFREVMSLGKPIIASDVDGTPTFIKNGITGLLFKDEDVQDLANKIRYLIEHPDAAREIGENAYSAVFAQYTEASFVQSFSEMVEQTLVD